MGPTSPPRHCTNCRLRLAPESFLPGLPRTLKYRVLLKQDEDGVFVATAPSLPGCVADGPTRDAAVASVRDAVALYLESLDEHGDSVPPVRPRRRGVFLAMPGSKPQGPGSQPWQTWVSV